MSRTDTRVVLKFTKDGRVITRVGTRTDTRVVLKLHFKSFYILKHITRTDTRVVLKLGLVLSVLSVYIASNRHKSCIEIYDHKYGLTLAHPLEPTQELYWNKHRLQHLQHQLQLEPTQELYWNSSGSITFNPFVYTRTDTRVVLKLFNTITKKKGWNSNRHKSCIEIFLSSPELTALLTRTDTRVVLKYCRC